MDVFLKTIAGVFFTLILIVTTAKQGKDISAILSIGACCMVGVIALSYLKPVIDFLQILQEKTGIDGAYLRVLLKGVAIALLGEITGLICTDAGNSSLGKVVQILASTAILYLSIPLLERLVALIEEVLTLG